MKTRIKTLAICILAVVVLSGVFVTLAFKKPESTKRGEPANATVMQTMQNLQIPFIANAGQIDNDVGFYANTFAGQVSVTRGGEIVYSLPKVENGQTGRAGVVRAVTLKEELIGGKTGGLVGEERAAGRVNYFIGNNPSGWKTNVSTYNVVSLGEVYEGIELEVKAHGNNVEKLFSVKPNANPEAIQMRISGAKSLQVNKNGQLEVETELGNVAFTKPIAYQIVASKKEYVGVSYQILPTPDLTYAFSVDEYDRTQELVIDPLLASTFLGGHETDEIASMSIDKEGHIYVTGATYASPINKIPVFDFPTTANAYDTSYNGKSDVFVSKFDGELKTLLASTYLGGSGYDETESIAIDQDGNIFVAGHTSSLDFPITKGAYQSSNTGYSVGFVSKLDANLSSLLASTYFGWSDTPVSSIAVGSGGNVYVAGSTSGDALVEGGNVTYSFQTTTGAYDTSLNGGSDVFVSKFSGSLTDLLASTLLGGTKDEYASDIAVDLNGNIYVVGKTESSDFPTTSGAYDVSFTGKGKIFISRFDGELKELVASTYLGGSTSQEVYSMDMDKEGNVFVAGTTGSIDFPITTNAYDSTYNGGDYDGFVSKLNGNLTTLLGSTYLGGVERESIAGVTVDSEGNVYVAGKTVSTDFPTTVNAYASSKKNTYKLTTDVFVSKLDGSLKNLLASTYFGGSYTDECSSIAISPDNAICISGATWGNFGKSDFPATENAYDTTYNAGDEDGFVATFDKDLSSGASVLSLPTPTPAVSASPTPASSFSPTPTPVATGNPATGTIYGYVRDAKSKIQGATVLVYNKNKNFLKQTITNNSGDYEFKDLEANTYTIRAFKTGYKSTIKTVVLKEGESKKIVIKLNK